MSGETQGVSKSLEEVVLAYEMRRVLVDGDIIEDLSLVSDGLPLQIDHDVVNRLNLLLA